MIGVIAVVCAAAASAAAGQAKEIKQPEEPPKKESWWERNALYVFFAMEISLYTAPWAMMGFLLYKVLSWKLETLAQ